MRRPNILDVTRAIRAVAPAHPEVKVWWYSPAVVFRLAGESTEEPPPLMVVLELDAGASPDLDGIASKLSDQLAGTRFSVRRHRGEAEDRQLVRVLTA